MAGLAHIDEAKSLRTRPSAAETVKPATAAELLERQLLLLVMGERELAAQDPFGNPVLSVALAVNQQLERAEFSEDELIGLVRHLTAKALADRAERLALYVGGVDEDADGAALTAVFESMARGPGGRRARFEEFRGAVERSRFAAVFTAHPTFALPRVVGELLARAASLRDPRARATLLAQAAGVSHRPDETIALEDEFIRARDAIDCGRDALDRLAGIALDVARAHWPERWAELRPHPVALASWVGLDTDGRADIGWWDTLRLSLKSKRSQLERLGRQIAEIRDPSAEPVRARLALARKTVERQLREAPPPALPPSAEAVRRFAHAVVDQREAALSEAAPLLALFDEAIAAAADEDAKRELAIAATGLAANGLAMARPHLRLNATQIHNALRRVVGLDAAPADPVHRRSHLTAINALLEAVEPVPVDFGSLMVESTSAARQMMLLAQLLKHIDGSAPVRFLIAETETGYTLLAALWLARRYGVDEMVEITPLFETAQALEQGTRVLEDALRSAHFRNYVRRLGRIAVQFGYSDSGRYIGQLAASFWIERLRLKLAELLHRHGLEDIEVVLFDTHGESMGRGGHPKSLGDRLAYLAPPASEEKLASAGLRLRHESSFQGGDGYLLFGTPELAFASVARIAEHVFAQAPAASDPIYGEPDYTAEFFAAIRDEMTQLVEDPGYASLLGTFGPNLLDQTGSRPPAREIEGREGPPTITHPRQLRAIPNNAILQQLGWLANSLHGLGRAVAHAPELFAQLRLRSERFRRALELAEGAAAMSDLDVLRAYIDTLDPESWLDRARRAEGGGRRRELTAIATALDQLDLAPRLRRLFLRFGRDWLQLNSVMKPPAMAPRLVLLHALRLAAIHRIWILAADIPDFSPRYAMTRDALFQRLLRLDVPACLSLLDEIFPVTADPAADLDFAEPAGPRQAHTYEAEHRRLFEPIARLFSAVREVSAAISHEIGAMG